MPNSRRPIIEDLERNLLRALCSPHTTVAARQNLISNMAHYSWLDHEHRVVFNALARLRGRELHDVRSALPAVSTRMGFPDVNWHEFFEADPPDDLDPFVIARALLAASSPETQ